MSVQELAAIDAALMHRTGSSELWQPASGDVGCSHEQLVCDGIPDQQTLVEEIIKAIDISELPDGTKLTREKETGPYLRVYRVQDGLIRWHKVLLR